MTSNISVCGGKINYELVKDLTASENLERIIDHTELILKDAEKNEQMFKLKIINLYKEYIFLDDDIGYNDTDKIDYYYDSIITLFNIMLMSNDTDFHINRIKHELSLQDDLLDVFEKYYFSKTGNNINEIKKINTNRLLRGIFEKVKDESYEAYTVESCKEYFDFLSSKSNPNYDNKNNISTLLDYKQLDLYVLQNIKALDDIKKSIRLYGNIFLDTKLDSLVKSKLKNKIMNNQSPIKSLHHYFETYKRGIYVLINNSKVSIFAPFDNINYRNNITKSILFKLNDKIVSSKEFFKSKVQNDSLYFDNKIVVNEIIGDKGFLQIRSMLDDLCENRIISDCEFIINLNNSPINYSTENSLPILSFSGIDESKDIIIPNSDDWELATQLVFPKSKDRKSACSKDYSDELYLKNKIPWLHKKNIAIFRGKCVYNENDCRYKLYKLVSKNKYFDVKFTSIDNRNIVLSENSDELIISKMENKKIKLDIGKHNYISMMNQMKYKYIIYIDDSSRSSERYSFLMKSGSVILKVESKNKLWYDNLLIPFIDHIPIKEDLSDLEDKVKWCIENDDKCKHIASNAYNLYNKLITKGSIMDYLQLIFYRISETYENKMIVNNDLDIQYCYKLNYFKHKVLPLLEESKILDKIDIPERPNINIDNIKEYSTDINYLINHKISIDKKFITYVDDYEKSLKELINLLYKQIN